MKSQALKSRTGSETVDRILLLFYSHVMTGVQHVEKDEVNISGAAGQTNLM